MKAPKAKSLEAAQARAGRLFILPSMAVFTAFVFLPLLASFAFSAFKIDMMFRTLDFQGLGNYGRLLSDGRFWNSLTNTLYYTAGMVPIQVALALLTAVALREQTKFNSFIKSIYFLPAICSMTIISILWMFILNKNVGIFSYYLSRLGLSLPELLKSPTLAMPTIIAVGVWKNLGFNMVILIAGLQGISDSYYEAADLDGASAWHKLTRITFPMLMPTLTFVTVNSVISSFQVFDQVFVMTGGGPLYRTETVVQYIYNCAFTKFDRGYASAVAVALLMITLAVSAVLFRSMKKDEADLM